MPRLAVLGHPVAHSRSPAIHSAALAELGLGDTWSYEAIDVSPQGLGALLRSLPDDGFVGVNVTVPHKLAALALADGATAAARSIGAANTLCFAKGRIDADNTDAGGLIAALPGPVDGARALVLGAGGSARAAVWALSEAGAAVAIWNRTVNKAARLAAQMRATQAPADVDLGAFDLLVNCTTVGMEAANPPGGYPLDDSGLADLKALPGAADAIRAGQVVVDLVYGTVQTPLASLARSRGATLVDGLEVLVQQGAASLRAWTGVEPPLDTMRAAARG